MDRDPSGVRREVADPPPKPVVWLHRSRHCRATDFWCTDGRHLIGEFGEIASEPLIADPLPVVIVPLPASRGSDTAKLPVSRETIITDA